MRCNLHKSYFDMTIRCHYMATHLVLLCILYNTKTV